MSGALLVLNAGSSSVKAALYDAEGRRRRLKLRVERIGDAPRLAIDRDGVKSGRDLPAGTDHAAAVECLLAAAQEGASPLVAVGHRVVHGGAERAEPLRIDAAVLAELDGYGDLAPLHQPHNLAAIRAVAAQHPDLPQVACFDTAFHRGHDPIVDRFALPRALHDQGMRRYGFHGLSYQHIAEVLAADWPALHAGRVVVAHLGAGASLCALAGGRSRDTTMGMTALDGLPMATRPGALDPGVLLHLVQARGMGGQALSDLLYNDCGLKGVSGISGDMKTLAESGDPRAAEARALFAFRVAKEIGAMAAVLGGLDAVVFTAGVGEHDAAIRADILARSAWLGLTLDAAANAADATVISSGGLSREGNPVLALVLRTDEEGVIARATARLLAGG